jgi:hypothetical protein
MLSYSYRCLFPPEASQNFCMQCQKYGIFKTQKIGTFGVPNRIVRDTRTLHFKTHKPKTVPGNPAGMESLFVMVELNVEDK